MPELPEVEVSRLGITPHLQDQVIEKVIVRQKQLRWPIDDEVIELNQAKVHAIRRRAKYLFIDTDEGSVILHLGMSGKLCVVAANTAVAKHDHVDIVLTNGECLRFNDPRRFGAVLWQAKGETHKLLQKLGPEPLTSDFDGQLLFDKSRKKTQAVKTFVMDNHVVVGVGNIYANEALFSSGIDPRKPAGKVSKAKYMQLAKDIKVTLATAIEVGGTTLKDFAQADGKPGYFAQQLRVYGRAGEKCLVCDTVLKDVRIGQRNTFFCPSCQG